MLEGTMTRQTAPMPQTKVGDRVFIQRSSHTPYAGQIGTVTEINNDDVYRPILVRFTDGLQFRYAQSELIPESPHHHGA